MKIEKVCQNGVYRAYKGDVLLSFNLVLFFDKGQMAIRVDNGKLDTRNCRNNDYKLFGEKFLYQWKYKTTGE